MTKRELIEDMIDCMGIHFGYDSAQYTEFQGMCESGKYSIDRLMNCFLIVTR